VGGRDYRAGVDSALRGAALPYGYTLTTWCCGEALTDVRGRPSAWLAVSYVAGALAAFGLLKALARGTAPATNAMQLADDAHVVRAGAAHVGAIAAAVGAVALIAHIGSGGAWPLGGFAATALYLLGAGVELGLRERSQRQPSR